jgi:NAD(P)-dependent dehydrogenase (short-subunit alcohol dehydrogenase family)
MQELNERVAVITGGASGIGLATARRLAAAGMRLVLADIEQPRLDAAVAEIAASGAEVLGVATDVGELAQVQALADRAYERFGAVHVVFNNAGVALFGPIQEMRHEDWEWVLRVDLWGVIHGVETFLPRMIAQAEGGHIVNTASFAGLVANQGLGVYCVAKYGVVALSECLYRDVSQYGIGVSVLCPMIVATNITTSERNRPVALGGDASPRLPTEEEQGSLQGGTVTADDVAARVVDGIRAGDLYILTHPESRTFIRRRFERIDRAFETGGR